MSMPASELFGESHVGYPDETITRGEYLLRLVLDRDEPKVIAPVLIDVNPVPTVVEPITTPKKVMLPTGNTPCNGSAFFTTDIRKNTTAKKVRAQAIRVCFDECNERFSCLEAALKLGKTACGVLGGTSEKMRQDFLAGKIPYKVLITKPSDLE